MLLGDFAQVEECFLGEGAAAVAEESHHCRASFLQLKSGSLRRLVIDPGKLRRWGAGLWSPPGGELLLVCHVAGLIDT